MKKVLIILLVILVPLVIYLGIMLYVADQLNNVPKPLDQALQDIKSPSFTIDLFDDNTTLPTIKTSVQDDLESLDPAIIESLMSEYSASSYTDFMAFYNGD